MQSVDTTATFVYNENGLRVQKTVNGVVTKYTLHSKNVVHMTQSSNNLHFFYDAQNKPAVVVYNDIPYSYIKNLQGDIVAILDSTGTAVVNYVYDAWGRPISKTGSMAGTLGTVQPFRYRGYVYDEETGLYYLRSRYYNRCCFERLCIHYGNVCRLTYSAINEQIRKNAQKPRFRCSLWVVKNAINCDLRPNSFLFFDAPCAVFTICSFIASKEETEKRLLTPDTQKLIKEIKQLYHDAIGSYPTVIICKAIIKDIEGKVYSMEQLEYALQETAFAPRPSWAYAAAILRRLQAEDGLPF